MFFLIIRHVIQRFIHITKIKIIICLICIHFNCLQILNVKFILHKFVSDQPVPVRMHGNVASIQRNSIMCDSICNTLERAEQDTNLNYTMSSKSLSATMEANIYFFP